MYDSKAGVLDVKVEIDKEKICDIEMQVKDLKNIEKWEIYRGKKYNSNKSAKFWIL